MVKAWVVAAALGVAPMAAMAQDVDVDMRRQPGREVNVNVDGDRDFDRVDYRDRGNGAPSEGMWELRLSGSGVNDPDFDSGGGALNFDLGYYLTDAWQISLRQSAGFATTETNDSWSASSRVAIDYNFDMGDWVPFVGANIGYLYGDDTEDGWVAAPEAGVKWYVKPETFIYGQVEYQFPLEDSVSDGAFVYSVGFGINWE